MQTMFSYFGRDLWQLHNLMALKVFCTDFGRGLFQSAMLAR